MPLYKFDQNDIFHNRIEAHPQCNFLIYSGSVYYNNKSQTTGTLSKEQYVPSGHIDLNELNVDRVTVANAAYSKDAAYAVGSIVIDSVGSITAGDEIVLVGTNGTRYRLAAHVTTTTNEDTIFPTFKIESSASDTADNMVTAINALNSFAATKITNGVQITQIVAGAGGNTVINGGGTLDEALGVVTLTSFAGGRSVKHVHPYIVKSTEYADFRRRHYYDDADGKRRLNHNRYSIGDIITGSYPMTATIMKEYLASNHVAKAAVDITRAEDLGSPVDPLGSETGEQIIRPNTVGNRATYGVHLKSSLGSKINALKNTLDSYIPLSHHYAFSSASIASSSSLKHHLQSSHKIVTWNKSEQEIGLVSIPSIFYGREIQKGTLDLKFYITGTLVGQLKDENKNGELIQVGPSGSHRSGSVAGVALYREGFLLLTGSWDLTSLSSSAEAALTFTKLPSNNDTVTLSDSDGTTTVFKFSTDNNFWQGETHVDGTSVSVGIENAGVAATAAQRFHLTVGNLSALDITSQRSDETVTLTQGAGATAGHTDIIIDSDSITGPSKFAGGLDGPFAPPHEDYYLGRPAGMTPSKSSPRWIDFAQTIATGSVYTPDSSFELNFNGTNYIPVITMLAHARKGHLNFSNNASYIKHGQITTPVTSSNKFLERPELEIKNIVSSSYQDHSASYRRQTYISKIGIYDKAKNLIGVAKVATPVKKTEERDFTFKIKLDI